MKQLILTGACLLAALSGQAQGGGIFAPGDFADGAYTREHCVARRQVPYAYLREGDVQWEKRVWREIDLREKINQPLYYPTEEVSGRSSLLQCLRKAIYKGGIIAFQDEEFMIPLELARVREKFMKCDTATDYDVNLKTGEEEPIRRLRCDSMSIFERVTKFRIKEDWFFDKQRSVMECRILGLCPLEYDEAHDLYKPMFWVYFPQCRPVLAANDVFNTRNDAERRSFDDLFFKRQFNGVSVKESNVYDRYINQYAQGIDALLESDRIKTDIFQYEHDLWHF